jgi:hypothetical protein
VVKDIRRQTRRHFSAEDKIRIVLDGLRGEDSIASAMMPSINACSSSAPCGTLRCVDRCCPNTRHIRRSDTGIGKSPTT